jgi:hypothetical protein
MDPNLSLIETADRLLGDHWLRCPDHLWLKTR